MTQGFALLPEGGLPRLIRHADLPPDTIATLDHKKNILLVNKQIYPALDDLDRWRVDTTHVDLYVEYTGGRVSLRTHP